MKSSVSFSEAETRQNLLRAVKKEEKLLPDRLYFQSFGSPQVLLCEKVRFYPLGDNIVVKQIMEEAVTRKFVHEESSSITSLCGAVEACLLHGLRKRALGLFKFSNTTALLQKVSKSFEPAAEVVKLVTEIEANNDPTRRSLDTNKNLQTKRQMSIGFHSKYLWLRVSIFEKHLAKILDYLVQNNSKYYESHALISDPVDGPILASLLVGPCALDYTKMKTSDHFWTDPPADELVQRHRIHSGTTHHMTAGSPQSPKRLGLQIRRNASSSSEESSKSFHLTAREYVESLHQNSKNTLLYGKNNVLVQPREGVEALAGYLSLHQTVEGLTIMWTPNQLMNGCCEDRNEELDRSQYWDYALTIFLDEIVYIHCHQQRFNAAKLCKQSAASVGVVEAFEESISVSWSHINSRSVGYFTSIDIWNDQMVYYHLAEQKVCLTQFWMRYRPDGERDIIHPISSVRNNKMEAPSFPGNKITLRFVNGGAMADLQERSIIISGVKVVFPCKPYPSQFGMMDRVIKGLERKQNGLLESPTGSGKSLALLCSALAWQHAQHEKLTKDKLSAESGDDCCGTCRCGSKEYSPETKPNQGRTGSSDNPVALSDDEEEEDDCDFKPKSKIRTPAQAGQKKHISIEYESKTEVKTETSPGEKTKCTCSKENTTSGKSQKVPKIYFGTRTHKQIAQITRELKKTAYHDVRMAVLASREYTCIHPEVIRMKSKSEGCRERLDSRGPGCKYNDKSKRVFLNQNQLQDNLPTAWDIEDFVKTCKGKKACPYFVTRNILKEADIIFCPYNYLIDPLIRNSMEIDLKDQIVILDEAHNMEDSAREAGSGTLTTDQITQAIHNLQELLDHNVKFVEHLKLKRVLENVLQFIEENNGSLAQQDYDQAYKVWSGFDIVVRLKSVGLGPDEFQENKACLAKALENDENEAEVRGRQNQELKMSSSTIQTLEQLFQVLDYMYRHDLKFVEDYRVAILKSRTFMNNLETNDMWMNSRNRNRASRMVEIHTLNFWCMNPAVAFSDFEPARNVILSSGTLSPMSSFASELGVPFPIQLEANHVIEDKQVWVGAIGKGPNGSTLQAVYKNMETLGFQDELGHLVHKVCMTVPHGVLCFLPSYRALEKFTERWKLTGLWRKISERKRIMVEPRAAKREVFDDMMKAFYRVVEGDMTCDMSEEDEDECYDESGIDGALFFAVCRGKVSEGMDFADNNARAVITVGIPYPSIKDLQVKLKREYNDRYRAARGLLSGGEWYEIQAFRALNQALGRCLRHRKDWGALIIVDDRFVKNKDKYCKSLSKWVRSKVQTFENFTQTMDSLSVFTEQMIREMLVVDADTSFIPSTPGAARRDSLYKSLDESTYISNSPMVGSQGSSSYFSPPENLSKTNFKAPQSTKKKVVPTPAATTTSEVSPKGVNPSAIQSPVTPSDQQFQQIMNIVNSAAAPKDKPYYIILNQGLPDEQTFLIEPPGKGGSNKENTTTSAEPKDLPVIAVPSTQKVMTPAAAKLANKMASSTGPPVLCAQTSIAGTTSIIGQTAFSNNLNQVPAQQNTAAKSSIQVTNLINGATTTPKKTILTAVLPSQVQSSQVLSQNQNLVPLIGTQMLLTQPQGLLLVGNNLVPGQQQVLLTQPATLNPGATSKNAPGSGKMKSLLGNSTQPACQSMVKSSEVDIQKTVQINNSAAIHTTANDNISIHKTAEDPKNKFLKFTTFPETATSKVATVAPMRSATTSVQENKPNSVLSFKDDSHLEKAASELGKDARQTELGLVKEDGALEFKDNKVVEGKLENSLKETLIGKTGVDTSVDKTLENVVTNSVRKRPLFKTRKSIYAPINTSGEKTVTKQDALSDTDDDFKMRKEIRKETKVELAAGCESNSKKDQSKNQKSEISDAQKSKLQSAEMLGKTFNAAGMTTRRKSKHSGDPALPKTMKDGAAVEDAEKLASPEVIKSSTRGETNKRVADKLKQFRRGSVDDGVLKEAKRDVHDNDFVERIKSPIGSPEDILNTRRRRSGRKRKSSPFKSGSKRSKGVDFIDEVEDVKENQIVDRKQVRCSKCGMVFLQHSDVQKRRRNPSFLKNLWPQNAEVLFFSRLDDLNGLQVFSCNEQGDLELNCYYVSETGCGLQYLRCEGCKGSGKVIGARVVFSRTESEYKPNQTWLLYGAVKL